MLMPMKPKKFPYRMTPNIYKKAEQYDVGEPVKHCPDWFAYPHLILIIALASAIFAVAFQAAQSQGHIDNYRRDYIAGYIDSYGKDTEEIRTQAKASAEKVMSTNPKVSTWREQRNTALIWCVALYLLLLTTGILRFLIYNERLYLCSEGLLFVNYFGKKARAIRWDEVVDVGTNSARAYILRRNDGSEFRVNNMFVYGKLRKAIEIEVLQKHTPVYSR